MPTIDPKTRSSTADPVAALLARLSRGRKANQPGAFGSETKLAGKRGWSWRRKQSAK